MVFTEEVDVFFQEQSASAQFPTGDPVAGILDEEFVEVNTGGVSINGYRPIFSCPSGDIPAGTARGDQVVITGVTYLVAATQGDGVSGGITSLILEAT